MHCHLADMGVIFFRQRTLISDSEGQFTLCLILTMICILDEALIDMDVPDETSLVPSKDNAFQWSWLTHFICESLIPECLVWVGLPPLPQEIPGDMAVTPAERKVWEGISPRIHGIP